MEAPEHNKELTEQLKKLVAALEKPKKDHSNWIPLVISFISTVVISGLSLYFSNVQSKRAYEISISQQRVEELKALNDLIPSLASSDTNVRKIANELLKAAATDHPGLTSTQKPENSLSSGNPLSPAAETSLIDKFYKLVSIANSSDKPLAERKAAITEIGEVAVSPETPADLREKAIVVTTKIAVSAETPQEIKNTANEVLQRIKNVSVADVLRDIRSETVDRKIDEIILHSSAPVSSKNYHGTSTIISLAKFQNAQWRKVSWHYAIAPDGSIWLGTPLNETSVHASNHNKSSVSILFIMDGRVESPTPEQQHAFREISNALFEKLNLTAASVYTHQHFAPQKPCPGFSDDYARQLLN